MTGDVFGIPTGARDWWFNVTTLSTASVWNKPRGVSFIHILAFGGGAGGGSPADRASGAAGAGAGGGGSGAGMVGFFQAHLVPDTFYVRVGRPGPGATAVNNSGSAGGDTMVFVKPEQAAANTLLFSNGGSGGAAAGTAGSGASASTITLMRLASLGVWTASAGQTGSAGTSSAVGADVTPNTSGPTCAGAAGGGTSIGNAGFAGGNILAGYLPAISGGAGTGVAGAHGIWLPKPLIGTGGAGGGGSGTAGGGRGGDATGYGCGGGGGGSGTTAAGGSGLGGNGGPGLVVITAW